MATTYYNAQSLQTWQYWTTTSATTTYYNDGTWGTWAGGSTATTSSLGTGVWSYWNDGNFVAGSGGYQARELTEEEKAERDRLAEERRIANEARIARQAGAKDKAKATFLEHLNEKQRKEYESTGKVSVVGSDGHTYHVDCTGSASGNVVQVRDGQPVMRLCAHARWMQDAVPFFDQFLQQVLHIQIDAEEFCRVANITHLRQTA